MKYSIVVLCILLTALGCKKKEKVEEPQVNSYHQGEITILTDDSFKSVTEALADAYSINYSDTKVKVRVEKEDLAFLEILQGRSKLAVMSRILSKEEITEYERALDIKYKPAYIAADAVVFIVDRNSTRTEITLDEIEKQLDSDKKNLIFDGTNSGNLNFVAHYFKKAPKDLKFSTISGNEQVIRELAKHRDRIGVISLNTISRPYSPEAQELRSMVKILKINDGKRSLLPSPKAIQSLEYPFTRLIYMLSGENTFGMANGLMRFASSQKGQIVVSKEGLQPYFIFKREVEMR
ncbi:PstS family phosphate ABC transporter substrate-binding protein [Chryseobacterium sp. A301]